MEVLPRMEGAFPNTQWTVIIEAVSEDPDKSRRGLEILCQAYRQPIVNWFRRKDFHEDPEDLAHSFIAHLLSSSLLVKVTPRTGRFRAFLATTLQRFLWDSWDRNHAQKRGGETSRVSMEQANLENLAQPADSQEFDLDFAIEIHRRVMEKLKPKPIVRQYLFQKDSTDHWSEIAARLGKTAASLRQEVGRMRRNHFEFFRDEVGQIVNPEFRAEETRYLYEVLFRHPNVENL